jgi:hypothetical protein
MTPAHRDLPLAALERARRIFSDWYKGRWKTQQAAASALGINQSVISEFCSGKQGLGGVLIAAIARQDPDIILEMLGVPSQRERVAAVMAALVDEEANERAREWAAKVAIATLPPDASVSDLARSARGLLGASALLASAWSSGEDHPLLPSPNPAKRRR